MGERQRRGVRRCQRDHGRAGRAGPVERQRERGQTADERTAQANRRGGLPVIVERLGTVFRIWFSERPTYMLSFFSTSAANNTHYVAAVGTGFDLLVLVIAALGIKLSARFSWGWAIFEYGLLVGFSIAAIVGIYGHSLHHTVHVSSSWFTISGAGGFSALVSGILLAIFLYSGWDTAAYVGEEAKGKQSGPAGITSVAILFVIYAGVIFCLQGVAPNSACRTTRPTSWPMSAT
jgi:amino acid transporter